jgi:hypothetical protein
MWCAELAHEHRPLEALAAAAVALSGQVAKGVRHALVQAGRLQHTAVGHHKHRVFDTQNPLLGLSYAYSFQGSNDGYRHSSELASSGTAGMP